MPFLSLIFFWPRKWGLFKGRKSKEGCDIWRMNELLGGRVLNGLLCSRLSTRHSVLTYKTMGRVCTVAPFSRWGSRLRGESSLFCKNKKWRVHYFVKTKNSLGLYNITCYLFLITQSSAFQTNVCMCVGITWDLVKCRFWFSKSEVGPGCSSCWSRGPVWMPRAWTVHLLFVVFSNREKRDLDQGNWEVCWSSQLITKTRLVTYIFQLS